MTARSIVAVMFAATICVAVLAPLLARFLGVIDQLPEVVVVGLTDLLKYQAGLVSGLLLAPERSAP